jgi:hypothetical protein
MEANTVQYGASKSVKMTVELNKLPRTTKDFNAFKQSAEKLYAKYNVHHLKTEYNLAHSVAQSGAQYQRALNEAQHLPYVVFRTQLDGRVRAEHRSLEGRVMHVGSREHQMITPPLSYGCRCYLEQSSDASEDPMSTSDVRKLMTEAAVTEAFKKVRGPQGKIFEQ